MPMTIRIAAIEVSHWHAVYDAAYLRHLIAMPDVELVAIQDSDVDVAAKRAAEVKSPLIFTDYRKMLATTHPDFVVALGRQLLPQVAVGDVIPFDGNNFRSPQAVREAHQHHQVVAPLRSLRRLQQPAQLVL